MKEVLKRILWILSTVFFSWSLDQTSCLTTAFLKVFTSVCVFGRVSCLVGQSCHMPDRTTRRYKETLLQLKERLIREQARRTNQRITELLASSRRDSDSDSDEEEGSIFKEVLDSLTLIRRDLYLGLLCLLLLIVLQTYWFRSTCLRNWVLQFVRQEGELFCCTCMQLFSAIRPQVLSEFKIALIYLEQWELLNPGGHYDIPVSGKIESPRLDIRTQGSLGYLFDWFLRPNNNKKPLSTTQLLFSRAQRGVRL